MPCQTYKYLQDLKSNPSAMELTDVIKIKIASLQRSLESLYQQQKETNVFIDDKALARQFLLQETTADNLTSDVIAYLFSSPEGQNIKVGETEIYKVIELGFDVENGEDTINTLINREEDAKDLASLEKNYVNFTCTIIANIARAAKKIDFGRLIDLATEQAYFRKLQEVIFYYSGFDESQKADAMSSINKKLEFLDYYLNKALPDDESDAYEEYDDAACNASHLTMQELVGNSSMDFPRIYAQHFQANLEAAVKKAFPDTSFTCKPISHNFPLLENTHLQASIDKYKLPPSILLDENGITIGCLLEHNGLKLRDGQNNRFTRSGIDLFFKQTDYAPDKLYISSLAKLKQIKANTASKLAATVPPRPASVKKVPPKSLPAAKDLPVKPSKSPAPAPKKLPTKPAVINPLGALSATKSPLSEQRTNDELRRNYEQRENLENFFYSALDYVFLHFRHQLQPQKHPHFPRYKQKKDSLTKAISNFVFYLRVPINEAYKAAFENTEKMVKEKTTVLWLDDDTGDTIPKKKTKAKSTKPKEDEYALTPAEVTDYFNKELVTELWHKLDGFRGTRNFIPLIAYAPYRISPNENLKTLLLTWQDDSLAEMLQANGTTVEIFLAENNIPMDAWPFSFLNKTMQVNSTMLDDHLELALSLEDTYKSLWFNVNQFFNEPQVKLTSKRELPKLPTRLRINFNDFVGLAAEIIYFTKLGHCIGVPTPLDSDSDSDLEDDKLANNKDSLAIKNQIDFYQKELEKFRAENSDLFTNDIIAKAFILTRQQYHEDPSIHFPKQFAECYQKHLIAEIKKVFPYAQAEPIKRNHWPLIENAPLQESIDKYKAICNLPLAILLDENGISLASILRYNNIPNYETLLNDFNQLETEEFLEKNGLTADKLIIPKLDKLKLETTAQETDPSPSNVNLDNEWPSFELPKSTTTIITHGFFAKTPSGITTIQPEKMDEYFKLVLDFAFLFFRKKLGQPFNSKLFAQQINSLTEALTITFPSEICDIMRNANKTAIAATEKILPTDAVSATNYFNQQLVTELCEKLAGKITNTVPIMIFNPYRVTRGENFLQSVNIWWGIKLEEITDKMREDFCTELHAAYGLSLEEFLYKNGVAEDNIWNVVLDTSLLFSLPIEVFPSEKKPPRNPKNTLPPPRSSFLEPQQRLQFLDFQDFKLDGPLKPFSGKTTPSR